MRNEDINRYMPRIYSEAVRVKSRLSFNIELDDLVSTGIFVLIDHINGGENSQDLDKKIDKIYT